MSTAAIQMRAHLRHRGLVFWSYFVPVIFCVPIVIILTLRGRADLAIALYTVLAFAAATGFFMASAQQEIMTRAAFYLMPGLARGMAANQVRVGVGLGLAAVAVAWAVPVLRPLVADAPGRAVSIFCLAVLVYALVMQLALQFTHLSFIVFQLMWLHVFLIGPITRIPDAAIAGVLDQWSLWLAAAGVGVFLVLQQVRSRGLHRRIAQRPYLSISDVKNPDKVQEFKRLRSLHKTEQDTGPRPFGWLLTAGLRRVAAARRAGRPARALALEALVLANFQNMPRRRVLVGLWAVVLPAFIVMGGYYDAYNALDGDGLVAWFVGLPFMAAVWVGSVGHYLRNPAPARLWDRGTRRRALWPAAGLMLAWGYAITVLLFVFGQLAAAVLPPLTVGGAEISMVAPRGDVFGIPLFTLPVQLLVLGLWRNPRCCNVTQQAGTFAFFIYHALLRFMDPQPGSAIAVGVALTCLFALPFVWNWRVGRTDQP